MSCIGKGHFKSGGVAKLVAILEVAMANLAAREAEREGGGAWAFDAIVSDSVLVVHDYDPGNRNALTRHFTAEISGVPVDDQSGMGLIFGGWGHRGYVIPDHSSRPLLILAGNDFRCQDERAPTWVLEKSAYLRRHWGAKIIIVVDKSWTVE